MWEDDITRRNAAIDRLYGLVEENADEAGRVARLLSVYVRELSAPGECPPAAVPEALAPDKLYEWALTLSARSDMENAVQVLGRLRGIEGAALRRNDIDLRGANLQGMDFASGDYREALMQWTQLQGAELGRAQLQGADLGGVEMQGMDLFGAQLQGATLRMAQLQGAFFLEAQLQGANLHWAQLQGADLGGAEFDEATGLTDTVATGASVTSVDATTIAQLEPFWEEIFADGSVQVPEGRRPAHWADDVLLPSEFRQKWRAWQRSIGQDPGNPE